MSAEDRKSETPVDRFQRRADEFGGHVRNYLYLINAGGIAASIALASALISQNASATWLLFPILLFFLSVVVTGCNLFWGKRKSLRLQDKAKFDAKILKEAELKYQRWYYRHETWDRVAFSLFIVGSVCFFILYFYNSCWRDQSTKSSHEHAIEKSLERISVSLERQEENSRTDQLESHFDHLREKVSDLEVSRATIDSQLDGLTEKLSDLEARQQSRASPNKPE